MIYHVNGFTGTADKVVRDLHKSSRAPAVDDKTWMAETAHRAKVALGLDIRFDTPEHFIEDWIRHNLTATEGED